MNAHYSLTITFLVRRNRANASGEVPIYIGVIVAGKPDLWSPVR